MAHAIDGTLGVDLTKTIAGTGTSNDEGNEFAVGSRITATDGGEYIYLHAATAISQYGVCQFTEDYEASAITTTTSNGAEGDMVAVAQVSVSDNDFFWGCIKGSNVKILASASAAANTKLNTVGTAGYLDDDGTTGAEYVEGLYLPAAAGTAGELTAVEAMVNFPYVGATI